MVFPNYFSIALPALSLVAIAIPMTMIAIAVIPCDIETIWHKILCMFRGCFSRKELCFESI